MIWIAVLFVVLGIAIKYGKMYNLIAGYNTMSPQEKAKYNIEKIATLFKNVMFGMALIIVCGYAIAKLLDNPKIEEITLVVAVVIGLPYLLYHSNSKKYKNPESEK